MQAECQWDRIIAQSIGTTMARSMPRRFDRQTVYSARKIEGTALEVVRDYFNTTQSTVDTAWKEQACRQMRSRDQD